jgi:tetratricopeptide (TPR) repeat protein
LCCTAVALTVTPLDILDVLDNHAESNLIKYVSVRSSMQGQPAAALEILLRYDDFLAGNPYAEEARATAEQAQTEKGTPEEIASHKERMLAASRIAATVEPGQESPSQAGLWFIGLVPPVAPYARTLVTGYCEDFPIRVAWAGLPDTSRLRLVFSTDDLTPLKTALARANPEEKTALLAELDHRFVGHHEAVAMKLDNPSADHEVSADELKAAIARDRDNWTLYQRLAELYMERGDYREASELAQSFPPLHVSGHETVELSNDIDEVANALYYRGAVNEVHPLLKIAADYDNGSSSSVRSRARMYVLDANYPAAAITFLANAQHYRTRSDFRDFLSLVFIGGESDDAWQGFNQLITQMPGPVLWAAAQVGHRRDNTSDADLRKELIERSRTLPKNRGDDSLVNYALGEQLTDRGLPAPDFADFIGTLGGPSEIKASESGKSFFGSLGTEKERRVGPGDFGSSRRKPIDKDSVVPTRQVLFAQAYVALSEHKFDEAAEDFDRLASIYNIESGNEWGFVLPYFALAAAQSGDTYELEKFLDTRVANKKEWGVHLAKAVFEAIHRHSEAASALLETAFRERPATGQWPVTTSYEYAAICIALFQQTNDARYKQRALTWARVHTEIEPTQAWAYALIARFGDDNKERGAMLAKALYLDPRSEWANQTPKEMQAAALASSKEKKPFDIHATNSASPSQHL